MKWSQTLIPTQKETPADAQIVSHQLMLRAGLIRQLTAGVYDFLPLGLRVAAEGRGDRPRGDERASARPRCCCPRCTRSSCGSGPAATRSTARTCFRLKDRTAA